MIFVFFFFYNVYSMNFVFFFFSSRRRHTRCYRDWSSDVCSSDLAAMAEELVVVGEDGGWKIPSQLSALALDQGEVGLGAAQLLAERRLLAPPLGLAGLEARFGLLGFRGQSLPELHEVQDLFLDPGLFLLDLLDLGEDGGVLLVRLDLVELALELLPLDPVVLEVLLLRALALPGGIEPRLGRLHRLARLIHGGVHGGDLAGSRASSASSPEIRVSSACRSMSVRSWASTSSSPARHGPLTLARSPEGRGNRGGGPTWTRTKTGPVMSRGLCQLSYGPGRHDSTGVTTRESSAASWSARGGAACAGLWPRSDGCAPG